MNFLEHSLFSCSRSQAIQEMRVTQWIIIIQGGFQRMTWVVDQQVVLRHSRVRDKDRDQADFLWTIQYHKGCQTENLICSQS